MRLSIFGRLGRPVLCSHLPLDAASPDSTGRLAPFVHDNPNHVEGGTLHKRSTLALVCAATLTLALASIAAAGTQSGSSGNSNGATTNTSTSTPSSTQG